MEHLLKGLHGVDAPAAIHHQLPNEDDVRGVVEVVVRKIEARIQPPNVLNGNWGSYCFWCRLFYCCQPGYPDSQAELKEVIQR